MARKTVDPVVVPYIAAVPAGTLIAAPLTFNPPLPHGTLEAIELQIPPGHVGSTGIRFTYSGQQIVPWSNDPAWINGDNLDVQFPVGIEIDNGLRIIAYNVGNYPHSFYLRFRIRQNEIASGLPVVPLLSSSDLSQPA